MRNLLPRTAEAPDEIALRSPQGERTWDELEARARRVANGLASRGLEEGERFALLALNRLEWMEILYGNVRAGTRLVPLNWHLTVPELTYVLQDSGARLLVVDPEHEAAGRESAERAGVSDVLTFGRAWEAFVNDQPDREPRDGAAGAPLLYTSGTTGRQKGVLRSDQGKPLDEWVEQSRRVGQVWRYTDGGVHLVTCPLYHAGPPACAWMALMYRHSLVVEPRFDAERFLGQVERHRVTSTHVVPAQMIRLLRLPDAIRASYDVSSLRHVLHGAAPCPEWVKREMIDWLGPVVVEYFGSSEGTGPIIATSEDWLTRPGTVGRPAPWLQVSVVDSEGNDLPPGEIGTLYFRREDGAPHYHNAPEKTAESRLPDGRFTIGDMGHVDEEGYVYVADRRVDLILSAGVNIYPAEVEAVLTRHQSVADAAVFGLPDNEWGQRVHAVVELTPSTVVDVEELREFCRKHLAGFKCPRTIDVIDKLPREASGKLKKYALREQHLAASG